MITDIFNNPLGVALWFFALVIAISIHEFAHAFAADRLGDPTPRIMGRLTLNPKAHLDPIGTIMILIAHFGWGKPVQFDPFNLMNPRRDSAIISLAGPASNLILAFVCSLVFRLLSVYFPFSLSAIPVITIVYAVTLSLLKILIILNVTLAVFNLIPIHPLDGFKIVEGILPENYAHQWAELERYGLIFLIVLIFPVFGSAPLQNLISPPINFLLTLLLPGSGII